MWIKYYEIYKRLNKNNYRVTPATEIRNSEPVELIAVVENERVADHFCETRNHKGEEPRYFYEVIRHECFNVCEDDECMENPDKKVCDEISEDESIEDKDSKIAFLESQVKELTLLLYECDFEDFIIGDHGEYLGFAWNGLCHYDGGEEEADERFNLLKDILTIRKDSD